MAEEKVEPSPAPAPAKKGKQLLLILIAAVLVLGFSYFLLYSNSGAAIPSFSASSANLSCTYGRAEGDVLPIETPTASYIRLLRKSLNTRSELLKQGQCDVFNGQWVSNPSGPVYSNTSCNFIYDRQNCMKNGRPDTTYLYWRWKPYGCELPPFDPSIFINSMKDKSWAFIGDSLLRNQMESILCLLSTVDMPVEVYHDKPFNSRTWHFVKHNFTVAVIWAPFLVKSQDDKSKSSPAIQLYLDVVEDKWARQYDKYDYVVFSSGQWFLYKKMVLWENNTIVGCNNCKDSNIKELGYEYPYRKALQKAYEFMTSSDHKPLIFFRAWSPDHFEYGEWFSGGVCNRTSPYGKGQYNGKPVDHSMRTIEVEEFKKAAAMAAKSGARLKLLDIFELSLLRPDGHPGPYRTVHPFYKDKDAKVQNDCIHWCLPGPIDTWNELMMKMLVDEGDVRCF